MIDTNGNLPSNSFERNSGTVTFNGPCQVMAYENTKAAAAFLKLSDSYIVAFRLDGLEWLQMHIQMAWKIALANNAVKWDNICCSWQQTLMERCWIIVQKLIFKLGKSNLYELWNDVWLGPQSNCNVVFIEPHVNYNNKLNKLQTKRCCNVTCFHLLNEVSFFSN